MTLPRATLTILDGALGILPPSIDSVHLKIGVCSSGTTNTVQAFADVAAMRTALGNGPLVEAVAGALVTPTQGVAPSPVYAMRIATAASAAVGAVTPTRVASSTGLVTTTGSVPLDSYEVIVKISRTGGRGVGAFQLSFDGGETYGAEVTIPTAGTYAESVSGVTVIFDTGTFEVGDLHSFSTTEARPTSAEYATALDAALANVLEWSFVHLVGTPAPEMTAVTSAGTAPPVVSLTGTPNGYHDVRIEITTGGARGTAVFKWSINGGTTYTTAVTTAATVVLTGSGLTAVFATGTDYATDNIYTAHAGKGLRDRLDVAHTKMAAAEVAFRYAFALLDGMPTASDLVCSQTTSTFTSTRVGAVPSTLRVLSPVSSRRYLRPAAWVMANRVAAIDPHRHPGEVAMGALSDVLENTRDERLTEALDAVRWGTLCTHIGLTGVYVTRMKLFAATGSDFSSVMNRRVLDKACRLTRTAALQWLNRDLRINPSTSTVLAGLPGAPGTIDERDARRIEAAIESTLNAGLLATGNASAVSVQVTRTDNLLSTATLRFKVRVTPKAYAETLEGEIAFQNPFLAAA